MLEDIEYLTVAELSAMTGPQIAQLRWKGETISTTELEHDADGNVVTQTTVVRTVLDNAKVSSVIVGFTYYEGCIVDTITERTLDASDREVGRRVVKHYRDGTPPFVTEEVIAPTPEPFIARVSTFLREEPKTFWRRLLGKR